jgi:hypothetical protein
MDKRLDAKFISPPKKHYRKKQLKIVDNNQLLSLQWSKIRKPPRVKLQISGSSWRAIEGGSVRLT